MAREESGGSGGFLVLLASYFFGRQALAHYAADLLAALRDDRRLPSEDRVQLCSNSLLVYVGLALPSRLRLSRHGP